MRTSKAITIIAKNNGTPTASQKPSIALAQLAAASGAVNPRGTTTELLRRTVIARGGSNVKGTNMRVRSLLTSLGQNPGRGTSAFLLEKYARTLP